MQNIGQLLHIGRITLESGHKQFLKFVITFEQEKVEWAKYIT